MKSVYLSLFVFFSSLITIAQPPSNYYDAATGTGYTLKTQLYTIIDNHSSQSYSSLWTHFQTTDVDHYYENDGSPLDMYSENPNGADPYNFSWVSDQCGNYSGESSCYNREHSMPKSWFNDGTPMYSDLFHLVLTDGYVNGKRGNNPFGEVGTASWTSQNGSKVGSCSYPGYSGTVFEPIDEFKGDFARNYFYMATRYENVVSGWSSAMFDGSSNQVYADWALNMLIEWHTNDPVSQKEIDRNNAIYGIQGNRNPFIDHPEWVYSIWGGSPVVKPQPSNQLTAFKAVANGASTIALSWTDATGANLPDAYLIKANTSGSFISPVDGTDPIEDSNLSDGSAMVKVARGNQNYTFSGLNAETTYYFKAWSYANMGTSIDFKLNGAIPTANATTGVAISPIFTDGFESDLSEWTVTNDADPSAGATISSIWGGAESTTNALLFDAPYADTYYTSFIERTFFNVTNISIEFWYYFEDYRGGEVNIYVNGTKRYGIATEGGGDIAIGSGDVGAWTNILIDLSAYTAAKGSYTIKIEGISKCSSTWQDRVSIDQVKVYGTTTGVGGDPEPTNHVADFKRSRGITLQWSNSETPDNYLIMMNTTGCGNFVAPVDGTTYTRSEYLKIVDGTNVSYQWNNLTNGETYHFLIVPFNGIAGNENYKTDGEIPCVEKTLTN